jgi:hypothetical protein
MERVRRRKRGGGLGELDQEQLSKNVTPRGLQERAGECPMEL